METRAFPWTPSSGDADAIVVIADDQEVACRNNLRSHCERGRRTGSQTDVSLSSLLEKRVLPARPESRGCLGGTACPPR